MTVLPMLRIGFYGALAVISFIMLALSGARLHYTNGLTDGNLYEPVVAELLVTSLFSMAWAGFIIWVIHTRKEILYVGTYIGEMSGLAFLWLFWLVGAGVSSSMWGNLTLCDTFGPCQVLMAIVAFAWLGWLVVFALLFFSAMFAAANAAWREPLHGRLDPRVSQYQA